MRIIEPSATIIEDELQKLSMEQRIEWCGRKCYRSTDKITDDSANTFVKNIIKQKHNSVLEMANIHVAVTSDNYCNLMGDLEASKSKYIEYSFVERKEGNYLLISGSPRAFREAVSNSDGHAYICEFLKNKYPIFFDFEIEYDDSSFYDVFDVSILKEETVKELFDKNIWQKHLRVCVDFTINRAVSHQAVRHRANTSYLQESQRYCGYFQDKFGSEVVFIKPCYYEEDSKEYILWRDSMQFIEDVYMELCKTSSPQAARNVLPNSCKTELLIYASIEEWKHIFNLRTKGGADPEIKKVMIPLEQEFIKRGLI